MSNETTLDDVLALVAKWRAEAAGDRARANESRDKGDRDVAALRLGYATVQSECADELEALLPAIKAALEDARRYNKLKPMMTAANFHPEDPNGLDLGEGVALIFMLPKDTSVCADLDTIIDGVPTP